MSFTAISPSIGYGVTSLAINQNIFKTEWSCNLSCVQSETSCTKNRIAYELCATLPVCYSCSAMKNWVTSFCIDARHVVSLSAALRVVPRQKHAACCRLKAHYWLAFQYFLKIDQSRNRLQSLGQILTNFHPPPSIQCCAPVTIIFWRALVCIRI
jgi:hypothetical protein